MAIESQTIMEALDRQSLKPKLKALLHQIVLTRMKEMGLTSDVQKELGHARRVQAALEATKTDLGLQIQELKTGENTLRKENKALQEEAAKLRSRVLALEDEKVALVTTMQRSIEEMQSTNARLERSLAELRYCASEASTSGLPAPYAQDIPGASIAREGTMRPVDLIEDPRTKNKLRAILDRRTRTPANATPEPMAVEVPCTSAITTVSHELSELTLDPPAYMLSFSQEIQFPLPPSTSPPSCPTSPDRSSSSGARVNHVSFYPSSDASSAAPPSGSDLQAPSPGKGIIDVLARHEVILVRGETLGCDKCLCTLCLDSFVRGESEGISLFEHPNLEDLETHCRTLHPEIFDS